MPVKKTVNFNCYLFVNIILSVINMSVKYLPELPAETKHNIMGIGIIRLDFYVLLTILH